MIKHVHAQDNEHPLLSNGGWQSLQKQSNENSIFISHDSIWWLLIGTARVYFVILSFFNYVFTIAIIKLSSFKRNIEKVCNQQIFVRERRKIWSYFDWFVFPSSVWTGKWMNKNSVNILFQEKTSLSGNLTRNLSNPKTWPTGQVYE